MCSNIKERVFDWFVVGFYGCLLLFCVLGCIWLSLFVYDSHRFGKYVDECYATGGYFAEQGNVFSMPAGRYKDVIGDPMVVGDISIPICIK